MEAHALAVALVPDLGCGMKPKRLAKAVLYAIAELEIGQEARRLFVLITARRGLHLPYGVSTVGGSR